MRANLHSIRDVDTSVDAKWVSDLVDRAWRKLGGAVPRERIGSIALQAAARYADARIGSFVPILIERRLWERLQAEMARALRLDDGANRVETNAQRPDPHQAMRLVE